MFVLKRLLASLPTLFIVSLLVFWLVNFLPGDPAVQIAGPTATADEIAQIRDHLGLNDSAPERYLRFLRGIVDPSIATSFRTTRPVAQEISERLPKTVSIAVGALLVGLLVGTVTGVICAVRQGTWIDTAVTVFSLAGISMPI
jgi:ABC-type dipeptide/oligopeptide/nickel transport system permease component